MKTPEKIVDENRKLYFDKFGNKIFPTKQNLSENELANQNIRGYAALVQELYGTRNIKNEFLIRHNSLIDPFQIINIDSLRKRALIEGIEISLACLSARENKVLRLYFGLDQPPNSKFMTFKDVGRELKSLKTNTYMTKQGAFMDVQAARRRLCRRSNIRSIIRSLESAQDEKSINT